jgi:hypothetical protein
MERAAAAREGMHYLVAGDGPGELFETWAPDPVAAVRSAYEAAGGGGALFDVVAAGPSRPGHLAVYAGNDVPILAGRRIPSDLIEKARALLVRIGEPVVRVRTASESPMVVVVVQPAAVERALVAAGVPRGGWPERRAAMAARLSAVASPHPGTVAVDTVPGDRQGPLLKVHARGLPFFRLMRLTAALEEAAAAALAGTPAAAMAG